jgi:hypothetical protein
MERGEDFHRSPDTTWDEELRSADARLRVPQSGVEYEMSAPVSLCVELWVASPLPRHLPASHRAWGRGVHGEEV